MTKFHTSGLCTMTKLHKFTVVICLFSRPLYFNYLEKFNEWMDQQSYDMLWDCYRIINMLKWWLNLFYANCIYKCLRVLRYPGIELAYPEKNTDLPQAQFTQVTGKIYHINCIKPPLLYSLWCLTPLSTIFHYMVVRFTTIYAISA